MLVFLQADTPEALDEPLGALGGYLLLPSSTINFAISLCVNP